MIRFILPIIFVVVAIGLFFGYVDATYTKVQELRNEEARFAEALDRSRELQQVKDRLLSKYNAFPTSELERLERLLPDNVDNVRLVLDIDDIASQYNMQIRNVSIGTVNDSGGAVIGPDTKPYRSLILTFSTRATYEDFLWFMQDLESSLRLVDIVNISFSESIGEVYDFQVGVQTYWLE